MRDIIKSLDKNKSYIIAFLIITECVFLFFTYKSFYNRVETIDKTSVVKKEKYSMYIQDGNSYVEYTATNTFPNGYVLNLTQSRCVDGNDQVVSNALTKTGDKVTVTSNQTLFCTLYFDQDMHFASYLRSLCSSDNTIVAYSGKVTDDVSQIGEGVDATKVCAFTSNTNNNVVFANHCWQIRRTTETGGVKIQYNGEPTLGTDGSGNTTYDCGTTRPGKMQNLYKTTTSLNGSYYYGTGYTTSLNGSITKYALTGATQVTVDSNNGETSIPQIAANYPYTCRKTSSTGTCIKLYKVDSQSSGYTAYVYESTYRDAVATAPFNSSYNSVGDVGYMYNQRYEVISKTISGSESITSSSTYVIGDGISDNGDGTFNLTGIVNEVLGSSWSTDYANYVNKYICMPTYWTNNNGTYTCSDNGTQDVGALRYITATTWTNFTGTKIYKYGYGIEADSGNYTLTAKDEEPQTLQYITNWSSTNTSKSHYTCYNLSGTCSIYYYINYSGFSIPISGGKYVSTDLTDTNNVLYEMLNASNLNTINSTIKGVVDSWYESNLLNTSYEDLIDTSTIFCNDRRITSYGGWNPDGGATTDTNYTLNFTESNTTSNLGCGRTLDAFSVSNSSAQLNYPIGLMSNPEMNILGNNTVRSASFDYWLSSPLRFVANYNGAHEREVGATGDLGDTYVSYFLSVRPAVSLNSGAEFSSGTGATDDPFVIVGSEMTP